MRKTAEMIETIRNSYLSENLQEGGAPLLDLVWTGHSAGGTVAALLYEHMMRGSGQGGLTELKDSTYPPTHIPHDRLPFPSAALLMRANGQSFAISTASPLVLRQELHQASRQVRLATSSCQ